VLRFLLIPLVALALQLSAAGHADEASEIAAVKAAMETLDEAFRSKDVAAIKAHMTSDHVAIGPTYDGPVLIDEQFGYFDRIVLHEWIRTTEPEVTLLSDAVAMTAFGISIDGTMDGEPLHARAYATQIWVKRDGKWLQHLYQETALEER
jgi:ketosteroid isomerase-like protein